jgi:hypothetical protein
MNVEVQEWRESFWKEAHNLPHGLAFTRKGPALLARDVATWKSRLQTVIEDQARRTLASGAQHQGAWPAIATDVASPSIIEACERERVGLVDRRGTVIVQAGPVFVYVIGRGKVVRPLRSTPFAGKAARLVRLLLEGAQGTLTAQAAASKTQTSYVYAHGVLTSLETRGFLRRESPRSGFRLTDPGGLLRAWLDAGRPTAVSVEKFNAPSTTTEALAAADQERRRLGITGIFTLASALRDEERFAANLPHGIYLSGDAEPICDVLKLRRITPHNFWILRPQAAADTDAGGVYFAPRALPHGPAVALPQLAVDFANAGGRGPEQATKVLEAYLAPLPYVLPAHDGL